MFLLFAVTMRRAYKLYFNNESYMTNRDGLCQGGPEGEKYPKTTRTGKATKKTNKKEVWKSLVRASSSAQPTEEKKEED